MRNFGPASGWSSLPAVGESKKKKSFPISHMSLADDHDRETCSMDPYVFTRDADIYWRGLGKHPAPRVLSE